VAGSVLQAAAQQAPVGLELRCGFFGADLELLDRAAGRPWVASVEAGRRLEVRALTESKADSPGSREAVLRFHLGEVPSAASFLVLAAMARSAEVEKRPLLLEASQEGEVKHRVSRSETSGGPGTLLLVLSRGRHATDTRPCWHLHDILPNSSSVVCGDRENTVIRELYWPGIGVAIQRSSPGTADSGSAAVSWLEVFQAMPEGSSSDDEDVSVSHGSSSSSSLPGVGIDHSTGPSFRNRPGAMADGRQGVSVDAASTSDSEAVDPCGYSDGSLPEGAIRLAGAKIAVSTGALSPEYFWPSDAEVAAEASVAKLKVPRFGTSPTLSNTSPSQHDEASSDHVPVILLGSPSPCIGGPPSLVTSPFSQQAGEVVEQPDQPGRRARQQQGGDVFSSNHLKKSHPHSAVRIDGLGAGFANGSPVLHLDLSGDQENNVLRSECELHAKELSIAAKRGRHLEEEARFALEQLTHERKLSQQARDVHVGELRIMSSQQGGLETELCQAVERLQKALFRDAELEEEAQQSVVTLRLADDELLCFEKREAEHVSQSKEEAACLKREVQDLRFASDLQKNQLSQSQALAAELRCEAMNLCDERDRNLAEAFAERVRAGQLQEQLSKEQAKLAEMQLGGVGNSSGSSARPTSSLVTLQQRLQESTLEADRERRNYAESQHIVNQLQEEYSLLQVEFQDAHDRHVELEDEARTHVLGHKDVHVSLCEEAFEVSQAHALVVQLQQELRVERMRSQGLHDELHTESMEVMQRRRGETTQKHAADSDVGQMSRMWERELNVLRVEFRETEHEFQAELASVRGRLSTADQRNRKLCESLRSAMRVAGNSKGFEASAESVQPQLVGPGTSHAPASPLIPAPNFALGVASERRSRSPFLEYPT